MFIYYGKHIVQGYIHPQTSQWFSRVSLQGPDGVWKEGAVPAPHMVIYSQVPPPALVSDGTLCVLIFKDG